MKHGFEDFHFLLQTPRTLEGSLKGFWRVSEGVCEGVSEGVSEWVFEGFSYLSQPNEPLKRLRSAFKNPSKTLHEGVEIDDALGFPGLKNQFQGPGVL